MDEYGISSQHFARAGPTQLLVIFDDYHGDRNPHLEAKAIFVRPIAKAVLAPSMIHEPFPSLTETAFGCHPCRVVSVTYSKLRPFHGGNTKTFTEPNTKSSCPRSAV